MRYLGSTNRRLEKSSLYFKSLVIMYFILLTISWIIYWSRPDPYVRPTSYFVILTVMMLVVFLEIFLSTNNKTMKTLIFIQITLISVSFLSTQNLMFPTVLSVDPWGHKYLTEYIIHSGRIPVEWFSMDEFRYWPLGDIRPYVRMPGFHLLVAVFSIITRSSYKLPSQIAVGFMSLLVEMVIACLIAKKLFSSEKIAMLLMLFVAVSDNVLDMVGKNIVPNTIGVAFVFLLLYLIVSKDHKKISLFIVYFIMTVSLVFTHSLSYSFLLAQLLIIITITAMFTRNLRHLSLMTQYFFVSVILAVLEWAFISGHYFRVGVLLLKQLFLLGFLSSKQYVSKVGVPIANVILARLGMIIYLAIAGIGILYTLIKHRERIPYTIALISAFFIGVGGIAFLTPALAGIAHRFWYYGEILGSIFVARCMYKMWESEKRKKIKKTVSVAVVLGISFLMFTASVSNNDNPLVKEYHLRTGLQYSELYGAKFVAVHAIKNQVVTSDRYYLSRMVYMGVDIGRTYYPLTVDTLVLNNYTTVFRWKAIENSYILIGNRWKFHGEYINSDNVYALLRVGYGYRSVIYSSGKVIIFM